MAQFTKVYLAPKNQHRISFPRIAEDVAKWLEHRGAINFEAGLRSGLDRCFSTVYLDGSTFSRLDFKFKADSFRAVQHLTTLEGINPELYAERTINVEHYPYAIHDNDEECIQQEIKLGADDDLINAQEFIAITLHNDEFSTKLLKALACYFINYENYAVYFVENDTKKTYSRFDR